MELREHLFLSFFSPEVSTSLAEQAVVKTLEKGAVLLREGDPPDYLYLILEGSAAIRKQDPNGRPVLLGYVQENDFVGEFGIIDNAPRCADIQATTPLVAAAIPRETILKSLHDPHALFKLAAHTIHRMRTSNQRHAEDLLQQERMNLLGQMISGILHDFRNPFAVISMASDLIGQTCTDAQPYCEMISQQIDRMNCMAEDILDFSRGRTDLKKEPVALADLFEQFRKLYETYFSGMNVVLKIEPTDLSISGDSAKLMRVLQNLTGNAVQAMQATGGTLTLAAKREPEHVVLTISDNGPGIPNAIRHNLFDVFSSAGKKDGFGIGLAVTQSIITAHGGSICFDTQEGCGTTFFIRFPS